MKSPARIELRTPAMRGLSVITRRVELLTPLLGGGVHVESDEDARQIKPCDAVTPYRTASIRGQLRFWWRATRGSRMDSLRSMREREATIWGAASNPGAVAMAIQQPQPMSVAPFQVFEMKQGNNGNWNPRAVSVRRAIAYGAFPLQPRGSQPNRLEPGVLHVVKGAATLTVTCPNAFEPDVTDAIDAWLSFGGVGGRTRRGFGTVALEAEACDPRLTLERLGPPGRPLEGVSSLARGLIAVTRRDDFALAIDALEFALERLQSFRQGPNIGRNPPANTPENRKPAGRSRWPEPEQVRAITGASAPEHRTPLVGVEKFPRAAFGLPIIFHFLGGGEPEDTTLKPANAERMASPLILRPFRSSSGKFGALALVLSDPLRARTPIVLQTRRGARPVQVSLAPAEAARIGPLRGQADPLLAFLQFFAE